MRPDRFGLIGAGLLTASLFAVTIVAATLGGSAASAPAAPPTPTIQVVSGQVAYGARLFVAKGCAGCHGAGPVGLVGPSLAGLAETAGTRRPGLSAEAYVRESIRRPQAFSSPLALGNGIQMPTLEISDAELDALVAFLLSSR